MSNNSKSIRADVEGLRASLDAAGYIHGQPSGTEQRLYCPACESPHTSRSPSGMLNLDTGQYNCLKSDGEHGGSIAKLRRLMTARGITAAPLSDAAMRAVRNPVPKPRAKPREVDKATRLRVDRAELRLWEEDGVSDDYLRFLTDRRGLSLDTIEEARLGLEFNERDNEWRILIPVIQDGTIINVRRYLVDAPNAANKIISIQGHGTGSFLYGVDDLAAHPDLPVFVTEGEFDRLLAQQESDGRYVAVSGTGGAKNVPADLDVLVGREVYIGYDCDEAGREGAAKVSKQLRELGGSASIVDLTSLGLSPDSGEDVTDLLLWHATADDLAEAFDAAASASDQIADERTAKINEQAEWLRIQREARAVLSAEGWEPPGDQGSWAVQKDEPDQEIAWLIPELAFQGANVVVNAQAKSGKTSLILNVAHSLLSGDPLFGHFSVEPIPQGRSVAWWNAELFDRQARAWLRDFDMPRAEAFFPEHLRGYAVPFDVAEVESWAVSWLRERNVSVWLLDPMSALYTGDENSNTEMSAWLAAVDRIKRRAGVDTVFLVHHVAESAPEESDDPNAGRLLKGRGASRLTGWADVLWSYSGRFSEPRYLAALGRDVDMAPFGGLTMNPGSRMLRWNGKRMTPTQDRRHTSALEAFDAVKAASEAGPLKAGELQDRLPGKKPDPKRRAIAYAVEQRWLVAEDGPRNSVLYSVGPVDPRRLSLTTEGSENQ
ncbi:AAA family ATPase [Microbacterium sp. P26]|uniref:AAA family ATPase n=1 Tax=Microbacterium TaxID=33882 RepID=UPI0020416ABA|nr:AAA family ATPase [Microbacterium sp. P26]MCM3503025.1 AAA family ATPase [Microbacterium sp. P26]